MISKNRPNGGARRRDIVKLLTVGGGLSQALALERKPVSVVHKPIEDGAGDGRIADDFAPMLDRDEPAN